MDILEFLQKSEWPVLVGGVIWYFRKPITRLLSEIRLTKFAAWGLSAEFEKRLDRAEALTEPTRKLASETPKQLDNVRSIGKNLLSFRSNENPQIHILTAWNLLEAELRNAVEKRSPTSVQPRSRPLKIEDFARKLGLTNDETEALRELRKIRNQVAHRIDFLVTPEDAVRFTQIAEDLILRIWQLSGEAR